MLHSSDKTIYWDPTYENICVKTHELVLESSMQQYKIGDIPIIQYNCSRVSPLNLQVFYSWCNLMPELTINENFIKTSNLIWDFQKIKKQTFNILCVFGKYYYVYGFFLLGKHS